MDRLAGGLRAVGLDANDYDYGYQLSGIGTRRANKQGARTLKSICKPNDWLITHSNGGCMAHKSLLLGNEVQGVIHISPALNSNLKTCENYGFLWRNRRCYPSTLRQVHVLYTPHDMAVFWGKLVPLSHWGDMGRKGYTGSNPVFKSHRQPIKEKDQGRFGKMFTGAHSTWFTPEHMPWLIQFIKNTVAPPAPA